MVLLQGLLEFRGSCLCRLLLLQGFIDSLLRLRGLGLDLAPRSRKLAGERCGTGLCLLLFVGGGLARLARHDAVAS